MTLPAEATQEWRHEQDGQPTLPVLFIQAYMAVLDDCKFTVSIVRQFHTPECTLVTRAPNIPSTHRQ